MSLDGGLDFRHPGTADRVGPVGSLAGADLAVVTGRGAEQLTKLEGRRPLLRDGDMVAVGHRTVQGFEDVLQTGMTLLDVAALGRLGASAVAASALEVLGAHDLQGLWIHLDVDVGDPELLPAVDRPEPDGLTRQELVELLAGLAAAELAVGMQVTSFDPDLDPDGRLARQLTDALVAGLTGRHATPPGRHAA